MHNCNWYSLNVVEVDTVVTADHAQLAPIVAECGVDKPAVSTAGDVALDARLVSLRLAGDGSSCHILLRIVEEQRGLRPLCTNDVLVLSFRYICPEPVLVKSSLIQKANNPPVFLPTTAGPAFKTALRALPAGPRGIFPGHCLSFPQQFEWSLKYVPTLMYSLRKAFRHPAAFACMPRKTPSFQRRAIRLSRACLGKLLCFILRKWREESWGHCMHSAPRCPAQG